VKSAVDRFMCEKAVDATFVRVVLPLVLKKLLSSTINYTLP